MNTPPRSRLRRRLYAKVPAAIRMGVRYWSIKNGPAKAERWPREKIEAEQLRMLQSIVCHAYATVPGYRRLCSESGVRPTDIRTLADITALPFMTKQLLRDNLEDFTSTAVAPRHRQYVSTSGSTGIPFGFYTTALSDDKENAFMHEGWERAGWKLGDRNMVMRGAFVGTRAQFWRYNELPNDLLLSSYFLTDDMYDRYAERIESFRPLHLKAYPSSAATFADLVIARGDEGRFRLRTVLLGSEVIYPWQFERIRAAFPGARVYGWYGQTEQVILAGMCESSDDYHAHPLYGLAEVLDPLGRPAARGQTGELVGTSFWSYATPLIRYRTLDSARRGADQCLRCGRHSLMLEGLDGRLQEIVVSRTGRQVTMTTLSAVHSHELDSLLQFRFFQDTPGLVEFRYRPRESFTDRDRDALYSTFLSRLGEGFELHMRKVSEIPRGSGGKFRYLDQKLDVSAAGARN